MLTESIPGVPKLKPDRIIDAHRAMTFYKPLPATSEGKQLALQQKVIGVYDKGKAGTVLETETVLREKGSGEVYVKLVGSTFFIGQGNWGGPKGLWYSAWLVWGCLLARRSKSSQLPATKGPEARRDRNISDHDAVSSDLSVSYTTPKKHLSSLTIHHSLNGDYNKLHVTPEPGKSMGFGGAIMHGLFTYNVAAHSVLKNVGKSDPANLRHFSARFQAPVKPGDKLVTEVWRTGTFEDGFEEIRFVTKGAGGKVVLSNGRALVRTGGGGSKL